MAQKMLSSLKGSERAELMDSLSSSVNQNGSGIANDIEQASLATIQKKSSKDPEAEIEVVELSDFESESESTSEGVNSEGESSGRSSRLNQLEEEPEPRGSFLEGVAQDENSGTVPEGGTENVSEEDGGNRMCSNSAPAAATAPTEVCEPDEDVDIDGMSDSDEDEDEKSAIALEADDEEEDENDTGRDSPSNPMICYRCPSRKAGAFRDRAKFLFHIQRHTFGENFNCSTCKRPFLSLKSCAAHEIRLHGTEIDDDLFDKDDPVISAAKEFWEGKKINLPPVGPLAKVDEIDEDEDFDDGRIVASTAILAYRGPPVEHHIQCYEIYLNYGPPKSHRHAQDMARVAVHQHKRNVEKGRDVNKLGRFSDLDLKITKLPCKPPVQETHPESVAAERSPEVANEDEEPMEEDAEAIIEEFMTCSSSSSSSSGGPPTPGVEDGAVFRTPRDTEEDEDQPGTEMDWTPTSPPVLRGILLQQCHECGFPWRTEIDLRIHRDTAHPTALLADLLRTKAPSASKPRAYSEQVMEQKRGPPAPAPAVTQEDLDDLDIDALFTPIPRISVIKKINKVEEVRDLSPAKATPPPILSALFQRGCGACGYPWKSEEDLRLHRDSSHPGVPLASLLNKKNIKRASPSKEVPRPGPSPKKNPAPPAPVMASDKNSEDSDDLFTSVMVPLKSLIPTKKRHSSKGQSAVNSTSTPAPLSKKVTGPRPSPKKHLAPVAVVSTTPAPLSKKVAGPRPSPKKNLAPVPVVPMVLSEDEDLEVLFTGPPKKKPSPIKNKKIEASQVPPPANSTPAPPSKPALTSDPGPSHIQKKRQGKAMKRSNIPRKKGRLPVDAVSAAGQRFSPRKAFTNRYWRPQKKPYVPPAPLPDATFTGKENFLFRLGLSNSIRLHLYRKKPLSQLKLPTCYVKLTRMGAEDC